MASNLLNAALLEHIEAMIDRAITARIAMPQPVNPPPEQPIGEKPAQWYAANLGFFDPSYVEHASKDTIFWDVHFFIEKVKDMAAVRGDKFVRQNLSTCLRGTSLTWYTLELTTNQKQLLKLGQGIDEWERKLVRKFGKEPFNIAMPTTVWERHTISDACDSQKLDKYANIIVRSALAFEPIDQACSSSRANSAVDQDIVN